MLFGSADACKSTQANGTLVRKHTRIYRVDQFVLQAIHLVECKLGPRGERSSAGFPIGAGSSAKPQVVFIGHILQLQVGEIKCLSRSPSGEGSPQDFRIKVLKGGFQVAASEQSQPRSPLGIPSFEEILGATDALEQEQAILEAPRQATAVLIQGSINQQGIADESFPISLHNEGAPDSSHHLLMFLGPKDHASEPLHSPGRQLKLQRQQSEVPVQSQATHSHRVPSY